MPMSRIRITSLPDGALVYEGEGELVLGPRLGHPTNLLADGVAIRQEERRDGEVRSRQIDITSLVREVPAEYRVNYYAPPLPTVGWDPSGDAWEFNIPVPEPVQLYELRAEFQPGVAQGLRDALERSFETPEERNTRERAWHEARLAAWRNPRVSVNELMQGGAVPRDRITFDDIRDDLRRRRQPEPTMWDLWQAHRDDQLRMRLYDRPVTPADVAEMFDLDPELTGSAASAEEMRRRREEQDELITSTRAEFPHDPYDYGRIYPGNQGTSRWTPPDDPNEKIRSCP